MTADPDGARSFYTELFGWDWDIASEEYGSYSIARLRGSTVAGLSRSSDPEHPAVWTTYLATGDADATSDSIVRHGGTILMPVTAIGDVGRMAVFQDAHQGTFCIWQAGTHTGAQLVNEPGALIWTEYLVREADYDEAKEFFLAIFGYSYTEAGFGLPYSIIQVDGRAIGGLGVLDPDVPAQVPPHFDIYFSVDDCDEAVDRVVKLGGTLLRPAADMEYGRQAGVADPTGAMFSVVSAPKGE